MEEARALLERFLADEDPEADRILRAEAATQLGALLTFTGDLAGAGPLFDGALRTLEEQQAWAPLANALVNRAVYLILSHRFREGTGVLREAHALAEEHDLQAVVLRARTNLAQLSIERDRFGEALDQGKEAVTLARERGDKLWERQLTSQLLPPLYRLGRWDEAIAAGAPLIGSRVDIDSIAAASHIAQIAAARGDDALLERCLVVAREALESSYLDQRFAATLVSARDALERGALEEGLRLARTVLGGEATASEFVEEAYALGVEAAIGLGGAEVIGELVAFVDALPPAGATPLLRAGHARLLAESAHRDGDDAASRREEETAIGLLRSVGARPLLAGVLLERARRHGDGDALAEARAIYTELGARRRLAGLEEHSEVASR
jgi:tetratricopeptide (TPR) repeat protein